MGPQRAGGRTLRGSGAHPGSSAPSPPGCRRATTTGRYRRLIAVLPGSPRPPGQTWSKRGLRREGAGRAGSGPRGPRGHLMMDRSPATTTDFVPSSYLASYLARYADRRTPPRQPQTGRWPERLRAVAVCPAGGRTLPLTPAAPHQITESPSSISAAGRRCLHRRGPRRSTAARSHADGLHGVAEGAPARPHRAERHMERVRPLGEVPRDLHRSLRETAQPAPHPPSGQREPSSDPAMPLPAGLASIASPITATSSRRLARASSHSRT